MKLFLGEYDHRLDERARVTLPRKIRYEIDGSEVVLVRGFDRCIFGFDKEHWEKEAEKHLDSSLTEEKARQMRRYLFAGAEKVDLDKLGRILLPLQLKEHAAITQEVRIVGAGDHFEIWNMQAWIRYAAQLRAV